MPKVKAEVAGSVLTLLGYDGTDFYNVLVDVNGRLQIDVIGSALPAGAATAANQALLLGELEEKLETADLDLDGDGKLAVLLHGYTGVGWMQVLIDALGHLQVDAVTCGLPGGAATSVNQALLLEKIKDQVFTYKSNVLQIASDLGAVAGENFLDIGGGVVGEMRVIRTLYAHNVTSPVTKIRLGLITGVTRYWIATCEARGAGEGFYWQGEIYAPVGVKPTAQFLGCVAGDDLYLHATGYNMGV